MPSVPPNIPNRLLEALSFAEYERVRPHLEHVSLSTGQLLSVAGAPIEHVYFLHQGVVSLVSEPSPGMVVEIATVGSEGMVGLPLFLGTESMPARAFCQIPGEASRLGADLFRQAVGRSPGFQKLLLRYTQALLIQIAQSAACNRLHSIEQRCARWLLMSHDRVIADQFPLTQEFLGQMLGVRRPSVSVAAGMLQKIGLIEYSRGIITIRNRAGLEEAACPCYRIILAEYQRLLGDAGSTAERRARQADAAGAE